MRRIDSRTSGGRPYRCAIVSTCRGPYAWKRVPSSVFDVKEATSPSSVADDDGHVVDQVRVAHPGDHAHHPAAAEVPRGGGEGVGVHDGQRLDVQRRVEP